MISQAEGFERMQVDWSAWEPRVTRPLHSAAQFSQCLVQCNIHYRAQCNKMQFSHLPTSQYCNATAQCTVQCKSVNGPLHSTSIHSSLHYTAMQCNILQCSHLSSAHCTKSWLPRPKQYTIQCNAISYNVDQSSMQCNTADSTALQEKVGQVWSSLAPGSRVEILEGGFSLAQWRKCSGVERQLQSYYSAIRTGLGSGY